MKNKEYWLFYNQKRKEYFQERYQENKLSLVTKFLNQIIVGDSEEILKKLPSNYVDLIFTSPPYNFGMEQADQGNKKDWNVYFTKLKKIFRQCTRVLKHGGRLIVNIQPLFSDYVPSHHIISEIARELGLVFRNEILWEKNNYNAKFTSWGSWCSPSSPYLKYTWEFIEVFSKGDIKKEGSKENIDITAEEFKEWTMAKWSIAPERKMKELGHDAMFPKELAKRVIKLFSFKGDIILDPFNGVGTTTMVAKDLERNYCGIDINPLFCQKAQERIHNGK